MLLFSMISFCLFATHVASSCRAKFWRLYQQDFTSAAYSAANSYRKTAAYSFTLAQMAFVDDTGADLIGRIWGCHLLRPGNHEDDCNNLGASFNGNFQEVHANVEQYTTLLVNGVGPSLGMQFSTARAVKQVKLVGFTGHTLPNFDIQYSLDGLKWVTTMTGLSQANDETLQTFDTCPANGCICQGTSTNKTSTSNFSSTSTITVTSTLTTSVTMDPADGKYEHREKESNGTGSAMVSNAGPSKPSLIPLALCIVMR